MVEMSTLQLLTLAIGLLIAGAFYFRSSNKDKHKQTRYQVVHTKSSIFNTPPESQKDFGIQTKNKQTSKGTHALESTGDRTPNSIPQNRLKMEHLNQMSAPQKDLNIQKNTRCQTDYPRLKRPDFSREKFILQKTDIQPFDVNPVQPLPPVKAQLSDGPHMFKFAKSFHLRC
jgi:hypothetical protein